MLAASPSETSITKNKNGKGQIDFLRNATTLQRFLFDLFILFCYRQDHKRPQEGYTIQQIGKAFERALWLSQKELAKTLESYITANPNADLGRDPYIFAVESLLTHIGFGN